MSLETLKTQAASLIPDDRRRLLAYLVSLEDAQSKVYQTRLREKIDDQNPNHWLDLEQLDERLGLGRHQVLGGFR